MATKKADYKPGDTIYHEMLNIDNISVNTRLSSQNHLVCLLIISTDSVYFTFSPLNSAPISRIITTKRQNKREN